MFLIVCLLCLCVCVSVCVPCHTTAHPITPFTPHDTNKQHSTACPVVCGQAGRPSAPQRRWTSTSASSPAAAWSRSAAPTWGTICRMPRGIATALISSASLASRRAVASTRRASRARRLLLVILRVLRIQVLETLMARALARLRAMRLSPRPQQPCPFPRAPKSSVAVVRP